MWIPNRIGIWGLSYGGLLTSQALARNSDYLQGGCGSGGRAPVGQFARPELGLLQVVDDRRDRWLEVAGAADSGRRRPQRGVPADDRAGADCCDSAMCITNWWCFRTTCTNRCCIAGGCTRSGAWRRSCISSWIRRLAGVITEARAPRGQTRGRGSGAGGRIRRYAPGFVYENRFARAGGRGSADTELTLD